MKKSAEYEAYEFILQEIITRKLLPNEQIVEQTVAEQTGISRTPIRSALKTLSNEGLVCLRPNRGAFVANPSHQEVRDLYDCKLMIEIETARLACACITDEDITKLRDNIARSEGLHSRKIYNSFLDNNYEFHMIIARASKNEILVRFCHELLTRANSALLVYDDFREVPVEEMESFREHQSIVDALCVRNEREVKIAMRHHIINTYETFKLSLPLRYNHII